jgi:diguanylate cyclase (GGDEF)-like protein
VRTEDDSELHCHHSGFEEEEALELAGRLLDSRLDELPSSWLVAEVSSHRRSYGRLVAMSDASFFSQERYLLELYGRYAATALDGATALAEANRGHEEARALLELARTLAAARTTDEVVRSLVEAVPTVVDYDRMSVWVWDEDAGELACRGHSTAKDEPLELYAMKFRPEDNGVLNSLLANPTSEPMFADRDSDDPYATAMLERFGGEAAMAAPMVARGDFLGTLTVTVTSDAARLRPRRELLDRVSGVVAQAATALQTAQLVDKVTHQARHDGLTGLANRTTFSERMEHALAAAGESGEPVALFFVDLDDFKSVNDELGHQAGDELLCRVAERLLGTIRSGDTVARLGGDEFAIVLSRVAGRSVVEAAAERVMRSFDEPFEVGGERVSLKASVGRAVWPEDAPEIEALMRHADAEMYREKRAARAQAAVRA